jgi:hypothetical protein
MARTRHADFTVAIYILPEKNAKDVAMDTGTDLRTTFY